MAAEPERNIEKELKAYAQQRRADGAAQPELHPATRKLLQAEAARSTKPSRAEDQISSRNFWSWPRFAIVGFATFAVVVTVVLLLPGLSKAKYKQRGAQMNLAANRNELKEREALKPMAPGQYKEKSPAAPQTLTLAAKSESQVARADFDGINLNEPVAPAPAAAVPPPQPQRAQEAKAFANPAVPVLADKAFSSGPYTTPGGAAATTDQKDSAVYFADIPVTPTIQTFKRTDSASNVSPANGAADNQAVLASFRVEQALNKLRVVDKDGSIYAGYVTQVPETAKQTPSVPNKSDTQDGLTINQRFEKSIVPMQFYRFRVSGTNRTLNKEVVFTGNFLSSDALKASKEIIANNGVGVKTAPAAEVPASHLELRNVRLEGRAQVGNSNQIQINALPVKP